MNYEQLFQSKLCSAADAVSLIPDHSFIVQGMATGEPPGLLEAIANRTRNGGFTDLRMTALLPMAASARTIFSEDVTDIIHWESLMLHEQSVDLYGTEGYMG